MGGLALLVTWEGCSPKGWTQRPAQIPLESVPLGSSITTRANPTCLWGREHFRGAVRMGGAQLRTEPGTGWVSCKREK